MNGLRVRLLAPLLLLLVWAGAAGAEEVILDFNVHLRTEIDGSVTVTERITVLAEHGEIKRGIYRDIPTVLREGMGLRRSRLEIRSVRRDDQEERYHTADISGGLRIYIGNPKRNVPLGRHTYEIVYVMDRQVRQFADYDEIYWNATGNFWNFPILQAKAVVDLPPGAEALRWHGYTGPMGAQGSNWSAFAVTPARIEFATTAPLAPREGLTVAVAFPKGFVRMPSGPAYLLRDNASTLAAAGGLALVLGYYLAVWWRVGRDPARGAVYPRFKPPRGISPAAARYLMRMGFDDTTLAVAAVSMAVKGHLAIREEDGFLSRKFILDRQDGAKTPLSPGEAAVFAKLFPGGRREVELDTKNRRDFQAAERALKGLLSREYANTYFRTNLWYFVGGLAIALAAGAAAAWLGGNPADGMFMVIWLTVWTAGVTFLLTTVWAAWRRAAAGGGARAVVRAVFLSIFAVPFVTGEGFGIWTLLETVPPVAAVFLLLIALVTPLFYHLLKAPTALGRRVMDEIEGFKLYLSVAEKDRMEVLNPPDETPELFERYLPYALALDVGHQWSERFAGVIERAGAEGGYRPSFYRSSGFTGNFASLTSSLSGSFSSAMAASAASSGSGGGGSSGGGGGGGGGGGW